MKRNKLNTFSGGWSLIELMVAVAIVGIIAAIAIPSYTGHITESRRSDGQNLLMQLKMQQEAYRMDNNSYAATADLALPASDFYTFTAENVTASTYRLVATAKSTQTSDSGCTELKLDQSMNKTPLSCW